ncbi:hypothetical protein Drorol1_Dr00011270 [Drosera rotundifolia]
MEGVRVLYVATRYELFGINLDELESKWERYRPAAKANAKASSAYKTPPLVVHVDFYERGLPVSMAVFRSPISHSTLYFVGGEIHLQDPRKFSSGPGFSTLRMSSEIYEFQPNPMHFGEVRLVGELVSPNPSPIVETFDVGGGDDQNSSRTFVLGPRFGFDYDDCPPPYVELLSFSSSLSVSSEATDYGPFLRSYAGRRRNGYRGVLEHFVLGRRMFVFFYSGYGDRSPFACFDAAEGGYGEWLSYRDISRITRSWDSCPVPISGGRSVFVPGVDDNDVHVANTWRGYNVLLFYDTREFGITLCAGIMTESGILLRYQDITDKIFKDFKVRDCLFTPTCCIIDGGGGRVYALACGIDGTNGSLSPCDRNSILCISEFNITKLSVADYIVSEGLAGDFPATGDDFVGISSLKTYVCRSFHKKEVHKIRDAFVV